MQKTWIRLAVAAASLAAVTWLVGCNDKTETSDTFTPADRMAIPAINTALIPTDSQKDQFNLGDPSTDLATWTTVASTQISGLRTAVDPFLGAEDTEGLSATTLTSVLIPDIVTIDFSKPVLFTNHGIPNGRRLQDDVINAELGLILNHGHWLNGGAGVSDAIDANDMAIPAANFPWLAAPHMALTP